MLEHFPLLDSSTSHYQRPYCPYTFINRNSDQLVVTVGASWTWGNYIPVDFTEDTVDHELHSYRIKHVYGGVIARSLSADFLNLAANGSSNFWAADRILDFLNIVDQLPYKQIYLIWTATDPGKGFNTHEDSAEDYLTVFNNIIDKQLSFDCLLEHLNRTAVDRILSRIKNNKKIIFRLGTDAVDYIGFDSAQDYLLPNPWLYSMAETVGLDRKTCYISNRAAIDRLLTAIGDFVTTEPEQSQYKSWIIEKIDQLEYRRQTVEHTSSSSHLFPNPIGQHPTVTANQQWADHILSTL